MIAIAFVVVAAAATLLRAVVTANQAADSLPLRTLGINVAGALALGVLVTAQWLDNPVVVATAGLGSLTTFSTVVAETAGLLDNHKRGLAIAYVGLTVVVGVAAALLGLSIGESL